MFSSWFKRGTPEKPQAKLPLYSIGQINRINPDYVPEKIMAAAIRGDKALLKKLFKATEGVALSQDTHIFRKDRFQKMVDALERELQTLLVVSSPEDLPKKAQAFQDVSFLMARAFVTDKNWQECFSVKNFFVGCLNRTLPCQDKNLLDYVMSSYVAVLKEIDEVTKKEGSLPLQKTVSSLLIDSVGQPYAARMKEYLFHGDALDTQFKDDLAKAHLMSLPVGVYHTKTKDIAKISAEFESLGPFIDTEKFTKDLVEKIKQNSSSSDLACLYLLGTIIKQSVSEESEEFAAISLLNVLKKNSLFQMEYDQSKYFDAQFKANVSRVSIRSGLNLPLPPEAEKTKSRRKL